MASLSPPPPPAYTHKKYLSLRSPFLGIFIPETLKLLYSNESSKFFSIKTRY